jgi:hypothetical protein
MKTMETLHSTQEDEKEIKRKQKIEKYSQELEEQERNYEPYFSDPYSKK